MREQITQGGAAHGGSHARQSFPSRFGLRRGEDHVSRCFFLLLLAFLCALDGAAAERLKPTKPAKEAKEMAAGPRSKKNDPSDALFATNALIRTFQVDVSGAELAALQKD